MNIKILSVWSLESWFLHCLVVYHLLSEDDVALDQLFGQTHGVLQVDVVILGAVYHHQAAVPHVMTHSSHARPEEDNDLSSEKKSNHQDA